MRLTYCRFALANLTTVVTAVVTILLIHSASAQMPEHALFQPGSYALQHTEYSSQATPNVPVIMQKVLVEVTVEAAEAEVEAIDSDTPTTEWEEKFAVAKKSEKKLVEVDVPVPAKLIAAPYLAWHRDPVTHRIHLIPYQPGYAASPEDFPLEQSRLNLWLSSLPCRVQDRPQVKYASYYDPDPVILTDKPSRLQLILGYPHGAWTTNCWNRWGYRMAQCPGVVPVPLGPYAEVGVKDQNCPPK